MPGKNQRAARRRPRSIRQSVTIPASLATHVRRVAKEREITLSRAIVRLAEQGVQAELDAKANLKATYERFMKERDPRLKDAAGRDLIEAIFGTGAIAEDSLS